MLPESKVHRLVLNLEILKAPALARWKAAPSAIASAHVSVEMWAPALALKKAAPLEMVTAQVSDEALAHALVPALETASATAMVKPSARMTATTLETTKVEMTEAASVAKWVLKSGAHLPQPYQ